MVEVEPGNPRYPYKPAVPLTVIVNPEIEPIGDEKVAINEGCLSVPDLRGTVAALRGGARALPRPRRQPHEEVRRGLTAGTFQHEVDHLDGVLFLDRVRTRRPSRPGSSSTAHRRDASARPRDRGAGSAT